MKLSSIVLAAAVTPGCHHHQLKRALYEPPAAPRPLGSINDEIFKHQEEHAEASDFVVYQHEWRLNTIELNTYGKDHVTQIASRLAHGQDFPVIIERSMTTARKNDRTEFEYQVHPNSDLDMKRRDLIVRALTAMGIEDAEERVVVGLALATDYTQPEAEQAYQQRINGGGFGGVGGGFGGGIGGFGGGGFGGIGF